MASYGTCVFCGKEILADEVHDIHEQVLSWHLRRGRTGGGHHDQGKFAVKTGAVAHDRCVDERHEKKKRGIPIEQPGLF
jgi:hypothetical protein